MQDTSYSSIWLYEKRKEDILPDDLSDKLATSIGRSAPTRGSNFSEFNPTLCKKIIDFWSDKGDHILDPFAGRTRALIANFMERKYTGFELSKVVCNHIEESISTFNNKNMFPLATKPTIINDDSFNIDRHDIPEVDLVFTCPPYYNIEKYSSGTEDLSAIKTYRSFLERYEAIFKKAIHCLKVFGYVILVIGDFRLDGKYIPFHSDNIKVFEKFNNMKLHDIVCVQSVSFDIANLRFGNFAKHKFTSKVHEYILVYKKIDF